MVKMSAHEDRKWMYDRITRRHIVDEFVDGLDVFMEHATSQAEFRTNGALRCPCAKCKCIALRDADDVYVHLIDKGFMPSYYIWVYHGEEFLSYSQKAAELSKGSLREKLNTEIDIGCTSGHKSAAEHKRKMTAELKLPATACEMMKHTKMLHPGGTVFPNCDQCEDEDARRMGETSACGGTDDESVTFDLSTCSQTTLLKRIEVMSTKLMNLQTSLEKRFEAASNGLANMSAIPPECVGAVMQQLKAEVQRLKTDVQRLETDGKCFKAMVLKLLEFECQHVPPPPPLACAPSSTNPSPSTV